MPRHGSNKFSSSKRVKSQRTINYILGAINSTFYVQQTRKILFFQVHQYLFPACGTFKGFGGSVDGHQFLELQRNITCNDGVTLEQKEAPLKNNFKFTHITGPAIVNEQPHNLIGTPPEHSC